MPKSLLSQEPTVQIHHVITTLKERYVLDPELGPIKRQEQHLGASSVDRIVHEGQVYERQPDGTFIVPRSVGAYMLNQPHWFEGANPFPPSEQPPSAEELLQPKVLRVS